MPDAKPPVLCPPDPLREFVAAVARRMGADADVAAELARHLVGSNLAGHDSTGSSGSRSTSATPTRV